MNLRLLFLSIIGGAILAPLVVPSTAHASPANPTAGDTIEYVFCSDVASNEGSTWINEDNDFGSFTHTELHTYYPDKLVWCGKQTVVSRSTAQMVGNSLQTGGTYARCAIYINGVQVDFQYATGRYAVTTCAA